jgi:AcrR family transcriptional regulator
VEEAALAVGISKRTAYRYFVSQDHMLADATLETLRARMEEMFAPAATADVHTRVAGLAVALSRLAEMHERELRVMMQVSLERNAGVTQAEDGVPARGRRRLDWIETALQPVKDRLPEDLYVRLVNSLAVCLGVDALIVLRDICGLRGVAVEATMIWMANAILDHALAEVAA